MIKTGFPPVASKNAQVLILGSLPGDESLRMAEYYAHPRNAFWFIVEQLFGIDHSIPYSKRVIALCNENIALWDVMMAAQRTGSLDSSIRKNSIKANDFASFYSTHRQITHVFFNGSKAEQEYYRRVLPVLPAQFKQIECSRLPSTSPAMAMMNREQKLTAWAVIKKAGIKK